MSIFLNFEDQECKLLKMAPTTASSILSAPSRIALPPQVVERQGGEFLAHNLAQLNRHPYASRWETCREQKLRGSEERWLLQRSRVHTSVGRVVCQAAGPPLQNTKTRLPPRTEKSPSGCRKSMSQYQSLGNKEALCSFSSRQGAERWLLKALL